MTTHDQPSDEEKAKIRFWKLAIENGLVTPPDPEAPAPTGDRTPIKVKGKPLSQEIIEERR